MSIDSPVIDVKVTNQTLQEGDTAFFTCQATGIPIPMINWYFNGTPVYKNNTLKHKISESSDYISINSTLAVTGLNPSDIGTYTCKAVNLVSSDTSSGRLAVKGESIVNKHLAGGKAHENVIRTVIESPLKIL